MQFHQDAYVCRECLGWNKVIPLHRVIKQPLDKEELLNKIYANLKVNNICHELIMAIDKLLQVSEWEFKTAADRDFITDEMLKFVLSNIKNFIKAKKEGI